MTREADIKKLIKTHKRHLQKLKEKQVLLGPYAPTHILIEIEDREEGIETLEAELEVARLQRIENQISADIVHGGINLTDGHSIEIKYFDDDVDDIGKVLTANINPSRSNSEASQNETLGNTDQNELPQLPHAQIFEPLRYFNWFLVIILRLDGISAIFVTWIIFLLLYAGGIWGLRNLPIMDTPAPASLVDLFRVAPGTGFYYPDWNAITFDFIFNPILAALVSIFPLLVAKQLTLLIRADLLRTGGHNSKIWFLDFPPWVIFSISFLLAVITVISSWFSRYQFYNTDPLLFRFYVLFLIGLSTYVRWSLLILALQTVFWIMRNKFKPTKRLFDLGGEIELYPFGELGILLTLAFYTLMIYAIATINTSLAKGVQTGLDALFWEAIIHLIFSLVGFGFVLVALVYQPHWTLQQFQDNFIKSEVNQITNTIAREVKLRSAKKLSMLPVWISIRRQIILLGPFFLLTLIPLFLWFGGLFV